MTAATLLKPAAQSGLQPFDLSRHLGGVAELIELCFSAELDAAGRGLIREMQFLSRAGPALRVLQTVLQQPWHLGFVWVEAGRVVGSVSTQRAAARSRSWLVANVAVHPDFRRHGIGLTMMRATLDLIRGQGGQEAILQVDDENVAAVTMYQNMGFDRVTTQSTWTRPAYTGAPAWQSTAFDVRLRSPGESAGQFTLASLVRPQGLTWAWPLSPEDFQPGLARQLGQFFAGRSAEHWVVSEPGAGSAGRLIGSLTVQMNTPEGDRMIMLVHPDFTGQIERPLVVRGLRRLGRRPWGARVEQECGAEAANKILTELGFRVRRTLRWMRHTIH